MAQYNQWMNSKLYETCAILSPGKLAENRKAFFGSIIGTLNHLVVADIIWLKRIGAAMGNHPDLSAVMEMPMPTALDSILYESLDELAGQRKLLDEAFLNLAGYLSDGDLQKVITYKNTKGTEFTRVLFSLLMHVFNHQTHHRGQATTLLSQAGVDVGVTDLLALIPSH
jgi:uncharacterized damage-inducible protein DinB